MAHPEARDGPSPSARSLRSRALAEGRHFLALFVYLWVLFGLFVLNERIVLHQHGMDFVAHGFAIFNAFVLAKVMLILDGMHLSRWLKRRPLIYPIVHDSLVFALLFILFHTVEEMVVNIFKGQGAAESIPNIGGGGFAGILCVSVILFFALIPFFAFQNFGRAIGGDRMKALLFGPVTEELDEAN